MLMEPELAELEAGRSSRSGSDGSIFNSCFASNYTCTKYNLFLLIIFLQITSSTKTHQVEFRFLD